MIVEKISNQQQADTVISYLDSVCEKNSIPYITAPELGLKYCVAVIRTKHLSLDLINPKILRGEGKVISFKEYCSSSFSYCNCFRYKEVQITNGFSKGRQKLKFKNEQAIIVQHMIDHLLGVGHRVIRLGLVRPGGKVLPKDYCPCGSRKRFGGCCGHSDTTRRSINEG